MEIKKLKFSKIIDKIFEVGILIKSFFGIFEILAGIVFAITGKLIINNIIIEFAEQEITNDPNDFFANLLINSVKDFTAGTYLFTVIYLIFHGVINLGLAIVLFKNKIWAYPLAMGGFSVFIVYQIYRYFHTFSPMLLALTAFDIFVVIIILLEYRKRLKKQKAKA
jgi:uncharacterized membrane protein